MTPPRLLLQAGVDYGFRDTLEGMRGSKPGAMTNWYAAVPSYHFGWILLATMASERCRAIWLIATRTAASPVTGWITYSRTLLTRMIPFSGEANTAPSGNWPMVPITSG